MLATDYILRRAKLYKLLPKNSIVVIYARNLLKRTPTIPYCFDQFSDFLYLTGQTQPRGVLTMCTKNNILESSLFVPQINREQQMWSTRSNVDFKQAQKISGVDTILPLSEFPAWIADHITQSTAPNVFSSFPPQQSPKHPFRTISPFIDQLKVIKSNKEIELIKKASAITLESMNETLETVKPGIFERQIAARFEYMCVKRGATGLACPIECKSGSNALITQNIEKASKLKEGEILLINGGCEYQNYASAFSRSVPIGKVNPAIDAALKIVERIKTDLVSLVKANKVDTLQNLHDVANKKLMKGLKELGVNVDNNGLAQYSQNKVSHWVGLDFDDSTTIPNTFKLKKGCVFTVEPGLYFHSSNPNCPKELQGVGIKFGDTVIIE